MSALDLTDPRRSGLYADAQHHDCEHYLRGMCGNSEAVVAQLLGDAAEDNPDAEYDGLTLTLRVDWGGKANHCPGFEPSVEYREELAAQERDAQMTWRENLNRQQAVEMGAQS